MIRSFTAGLIALFLGVSLVSAGAESEQSLASIIEGKGTVPRLKEIALYPSKDAVRVVIVPTEKVEFKYDLLVGEGNDRIYVDLKRTSAEGFTLPTVEAGGFLKGIRMGKRQDGIRIVFDIGTVEKYNVLVLDNPWRVVIDYIGGPPAEESIPAEPQRPILLPQKRDTVLSAPPVQQKPKKRPFILVLDPGHGGKDPGASRKGVAEKDIVLSLAKTIRARAAARYPNITVVLTREDDRFVPLEERAVIANRHDGDLFVSLHTNAYSDPEVGGVEVYHLDNRSDAYGEKLARVENQITNDSSFLNTILVDMTMSFYIEDSRRFADAFGNRLEKVLPSFGVRLRDWRKGALFFVLVGARMPSLLVEVGYLSNPKERSLMQKKAYLEAFADALLAAVSEVRKNHTLAKDRP